MRKSHDLGLPPFGFCSSRAAPWCPSGQSGAAWQRREMAGAGGMRHVPPPPRCPPGVSQARLRQGMERRCLGCSVWREMRRDEPRARPPGGVTMRGDPSPRCPPALEQGRPMRSSSTDAVTRSGPRRRIARPRLVPARPRAARPASRRPRRPAAALSPNAREGTAPRAGGGASERSPSPFLTHALVLPRDKALV